MPKSWHRASPSDVVTKQSLPVHAVHITHPSTAAEQRCQKETSSVRDFAKKGGAVLLPFRDANHGTITRTVISCMTRPANCEMIGAMNDVTAPSAPPVTGDPFARAAASAATLKR